MKLDNFEILISMRKLEDPYLDEFKDLEITHKVDFSLKLGDEVISKGVSPYILEKGPHEMIVESGGYIESNFYPINCSCLEPMCLGLSNGVIKNKEDEVIKWVIPLDAGYKNRFKKQEYFFDKKQYDAELEKAIKKIKAINIEYNNVVAVVGDFIYLKDFVFQV